ncbi:uncharacterized protein LOC135829933 [Sycon ciliatum]|uniref:uncharacterized protein LOC135829933 n=1 Tax=Sycon ciliatum TaxID=27933 RepID=UPI0031F6E83A
MAGVNPVQDSDFDELLRLEANKEAADGWSHHASGDGFETWVRRRDNEKINMMKTYYHIKGVTKEQLLDLMVEPDQRTRFDNSFKEYRFVKDFGDHKILYTRCPMNAPFVSDRDFVVAHTRRTTAAEICVINKQIETELVPLVSGAVRADTLCLSITFRDAEGDEIAATMCYILQSDYKISMPASVINSKIASTPPAFLKRLQDFVTHAYKPELAAAKSS